MIKNVDISKSCSKKKTRSLAEGPFMLLNFGLLLMFCIFLVCTNTPVSSERSDDSRAIISVQTSSNTLRIIGTGFGTKAQSAPVCWDDLEDGNCDLSAKIGMWSSTNKLKISNVKNRTVNSKYCAHHDFNGDGNGACFTGNNNILGVKWFCQYWFMLDSNFDWGSGGYPNSGKFLSNIKIFRLWNPGNVNEDYMVAIAGYADNILSTCSNVDNQKGYSFSKGLHENWQKGIWHCLQFQYKESDIGVRNGTSKIMLDGKVIFENDTMMTREDFAQLKRPYIIGFYNAWNWDEATPDVNGPQAPNDFYMDDVYTDTTWSRVEIGDCPEYETCTHREIQIPMSWTDTAITVSVNKGSFNTGATAYIFVVDEDGNPSRGFEMKIK